MRHVMVCLIVVAALSGHLTAVRADPEDDLLKKFQKQNQPAALGSSAPVKPPANLQKASASQAIALPKPAVESFAGAGSDAKTSLGPWVRVTTSAGTVIVPDGGVAVQGSVSSALSARNEAGVPIAGKVPYLGRGFRNVGWGSSIGTMQRSVSVRVIRLLEMDAELLGK